MMIHDLTKKIPTYLPTYLPTYIPIHLPTYPPTYLPASFTEHPQGAIPETCDLWDTDNNSDNWEPESMRIFVIWQSIVTLDSIRNSCDVLSGFSSVLNSTYAVVWGESNVEEVAAAVFDLFLPQQTPLILSNAAKQWAGLNTLTECHFKQPAGALHPPSIVSTEQ